MQKLTGWFRANWLIVSVLFLLAFIPLYPKLPVINVIRTWVYIRLEDFVIAAVVLGYGIAFVRNRKIAQTPLTIPVVFFWIVGALSMVFSILFIGKKIPGFFPHLALLHYLRRIEYLILFFVAYAALVKRPKLLPWVVGTLTVTMVGIVIYGLGQKFLGWPAYLTMNEEFAKGIPLRLPPTARVASTFGGHYDLAAYLVLLIPILASAIFGVKKIGSKILLFCVALAAYVLLLFTASRVSWGVYLIAISFMLLWQRKWWLIPFVIIGSFILLNSVGTASERFYKTLRYSNVVIDLTTGQPIGTLDKIEGTQVVVQKQESPAAENLPKGTAYIGIPTTPVTTPAPKPGKTIKNVPVFTSLALASGSGEIATVSGSYLVSQAFVYDISITTRFQGQWPRAMEAFRRNIFLGSGYSSLSLAVDGDYLRMLGETGIVGTIAFLGIFLAAFYAYIRGRNRLTGLEFSFVTGLFAGIVGLFLNAIPIDVFEASKVAFTLWLLLGVAIAILARVREAWTSYPKLLWRAATSNIVYALAISASAFALWRQTTSLYFVGDDFTWLRWAASTPTNMVWKYFTDAGGFFYRPIPKVWYFVLYAFFWLKPAPYHVMSLVLFSAIAVVLFLLLRKRGVRATLSLLFTALFLSLSIHHENIFWISGQSSLLSALFMLLSLFLFDVSYGRSRRFSWAYQTFGYIFLAASLVSYEGAIAMPVVLGWLFYALYGKSSQAILSAAVLPVYWFVRSRVNAVAPGGDYSVNPAKFLANGFGNGVGYLFAIIFGPSVLDITSRIRSVARPFVVWISIGLVPVLVAIIGFFWQAKSRIGRYKESSIWFMAFVFSLVPVVGLGGAAERYAFIPSLFMIMAAGTFIESLWVKLRAPAKVVVTIAVILIIIWNYRDMKTIEGDWVKAGSVAEQTLLTMRREYFPLSRPIAFIVVNTPIRYGRAWIFPTGLPDPLWHIFKFNPYAYLVIPVPTIEAGYKTDVPEGAGKVVLVFEDFILKRVERDFKQVEVDAAP